MAGTNPVKHTLAIGSKGQMMGKGYCSPSVRVTAVDGTCAKHLTVESCTVIYAAKQSYLVFTARCYASAVLAMGLCLSVSICLSVCHKSEFY